MPSQTLSHDAIDRIGVISLGVYAALLLIGGIMGYVKAGSKPSLYTGILSALFAVIALGLSSIGAPFGFWAGLVLSFLLMTTFLARFAHSRKFFPTGMLCLVSLGMMAILFWAIVDK